MTIIYIIIDYGRPQEVFPAIGHLRPMLLIILLLVFLLIKEGPGARLHIRQINLLWIFSLLLACYIPFARNNYYAYTTALSQVLYMPFILSVVFCVDTFSRLRRIIFVFICLMVYVAIYSLFHGGKGPGNYFGDENDLSLYINMWLPFCYFLLFTEKKFKKRLIYLVGLLVGLLAIVASFSRGGFVGFVAMAVVAWWFSQKKIVTLMAIFLVILVMYFTVDSAYWSEIATISDTNESTASERIESWKTAWDMFLANPLGVGGNNFQVRFVEYQGDRFGRGMWGRVAHSLWFTLIPELGLVGICIYFSLLYVNIKDIIWLKRSFGKSADDTQSRYFHFLGVAFLASMTGYFVSGTFVSVLYYAHYWYLTGLLVAGVRVAKLSLEGTPVVGTEG